LWDYDVAAQPLLFAWKDGTPAVAISTKMGRVFVLNRLTGAAARGRETSTAVRHRGGSELANAAIIGDFIGAREI
jgi:glucose dehydrogenase